MKAVFSEENYIPPPYPTIGSGDREQTRLIFTVFIVWPSKLGQGHQNLIKSLNHPSIIIYEVWPESVIWFKRQGTDKLFGSKFENFKMLVWLWKWGQGHQNLVKIHPLVQEIECKQEDADWICTKRQYDPPLPFGWGDINSLSMFIEATEPDPTFFWQTDLGKQCRPRSNCSWRSSLIRVSIYCHSVCIILAYCMVRTHCSNFRIITAIFSHVQIITIFRVIVLFQDNLRCSKMTCVPSKISDQLGHPPSLIRVFVVRCTGSFMQTAKTLTRLGGCLGWRGHRYFVFVVFWLNILTSISPQSSSSQPPVSSSSPSLSCPVSGGSLTSISPVFIIPTSCFFLPLPPPPTPSCPVSGGSLTSVSPQSSSSQHPASSSPPPSILPCVRRLTYINISPVFIIPTPCLFFLLLPILPCVRRLPRWLYPAVFWYRWWFWWFLRGRVAFQSWRWIW